MDPVKVEVIMECLAHNNAQGVHSFMGLVGYY
jgi:hypothetical protein